MTTTFDGSGATINQGTMTRTVCNNTLKVALSDKRAVIKTRHTTKFNAQQVGRELAQIAKGFEQYKIMGEAMAKTHMAKDEVANFFKSCLGIPFDAKKEDVSTRKMNQFEELNQAYIKTLLEGTEPETAWSALNAVTRYVDHDKSARQGDAGIEQSRFHSAQFGTGAAMKARAVELLTDRYVTYAPSDDVSSILKQSFKPEMERV
jgi:phage/plasmid-like protein (TIGR03299 family)